MSKNKNEEETALVKAEMPLLPVVPDLLQNALPAPIPQMQWDTGIIKDLIHNYKLKRLEKSTEREASISENKRRDITAKLDTIHTLMTFSKRIEESFKASTHRMRMMDIEEQTAQAELVQVQLKNMLLQGEVKLNEVELKLKMKEMEDILNGPSETEDRT